VKGKHGFPENIVVHHLHPLGVIGNFVNAMASRLYCKKCGANITLTRDFLKKIAPNARDEFIDELIKCSAELFPKYGINSCDQVTHLLAQAKHETKRFTAFRESLKYTSYTGQTLYNMAPTAINNGFTRLGITFSSHANKIAWIQANLINNDAAYGRHSFGTNEYPNKDYRGRGLLHLTYFQTYKQCAAAIGVAIDAHPELVETDLRVIIETGLWFWRSRNIGAKADDPAYDDPAYTGDDPVKRVTYPINSGYKGLVERRQFKSEITTIFNSTFGGCARG
jgi:predicted chitinase